MLTTIEVMENALILSRVDRSYIASKLIESLDDEALLSTEWQAEIQHRYTSWQTGETQSVPSEDVHCRIEQLLAAR